MSQAQVLGGRIGGLTRASRYSPRELTEKATAGFLAKFIAQVDSESPGLSPEERARRATALLRAHMTRLALRSAQVRREKAK